MSREKSKSLCVCWLPWGFACWGEVASVVLCGYAASNFIILRTRASFTQHLGDTDRRTPTNSPLEFGLTMATLVPGAPNYVLQKREMKGLNQEGIDASLLDDQN